MLGLGLLARTAAEIRRDVAAANSRDPAASGVSSVEILASWPGVHALLAYRVAHALHGVGVPLAPRAIATISRAATGIEIHPAAEIGDGLFIDHGMGVVIGETARIGNDVTLYQGHGSKIGANSVVIHDVPPNSTVVGNPGHPVRVEGRRPEGPDTDWVHLPDPIADAIKGLANRITDLERALAANPGNGEFTAKGDVRPFRPLRGPNPAGG